MKKLLISILAIIATMILIFYYLILWSPSGLRTQANARNIEKVRARMSLDSVIMIMGEPDAVYSPSYRNSYSEKFTIYQYEPPFGTSDGIDIYVDSSKRVQRIVFD